MIFIDAGAILARHLPSDRLHVEATKGWKRIADHRLPCATSSFILDEALTLLARRSNYSFAAEIARNIWNSKDLGILRPSQEVELEAIAFFEKYADQRISFTDCLSFALMRKHRIKMAFSFDRHFQSAGFELWPASH